MGKFQKPWSKRSTLPSPNMAGFTCSSFQIISVRFAYAWHDPANLIGIISCSFMSPLNRTTHTLWLSFASGTNNAPCKNSSGQILPNKHFYAKRSMAYSAVERWRFEAHSGFQQVTGKLQTKSICPTERLLVCYWLRLFLEIVAQFFLHFVFGTDTWKLENWNTKNSKLPLGVGGILTGIKDSTITVITGLSHKPFSGKQLLGGSSLHPLLCQTASEQPEGLAHLHIRPSFIPQAFVQVIILRLGLQIEKQMSLKFLVWTYWRLSESYKMIFLFNCF